MKSLLILAGTRSLFRTTVYNQTYIALDKLADNFKYKWIS